MPLFDAWATWELRQHWHRHHWQTRPITRNLVDNTFEIQFPTLAEAEACQQAWVADETAEWLWMTPNTRQGSIVTIVAWNVSAGRATCQWPDDAEVPLPRDPGVLFPRPTNTVERLRQRWAEAARTQSGSASLAAWVGGVLSAATMPVVAADAVQKTPETDPPLTEDQRRAVHTALTAPVTWIWGPPGTGKTSVITAIVQACWERGESVLVTAPTHVAVDEPLQRIAQAWDARPDRRDALYRGSILRWGRRVSARLHEAVLSHGTVADAIWTVRRAEREQHITAWRLLITQQLSRHATWDALWADTTWLAALTPSQRDSRVIPSGVFAQPLPATGPITSADRQTLTDAWDQWQQQDPWVFRPPLVPMIQGMTLAQLVATPPGEPVDVVIIDEVTMAALPLVMYAALWARKRVVVVGDFLQLPAIVPEETVWPAADRPLVRRWIHATAFSAQGITAQHIPAYPSLVALRDQFRMAEPICRVVNALAYAPHITLRTHTTPLPPRWPDATAHVVQVVPATSRAERTPQGSWVNPDHQILIDAIVRQILTHDPHTTIALLTPFRAQTHALYQRWRHDPRVMAATLHRMQGAERDIVILDPVRIGHWPQHPFLGATDTALQLWNVAVSRARRQVWWIAPAHWPGETVPARLTQWVQRVGQVIRIDERHSAEGV